MLSAIGLVWVGSQLQFFRAPDGWIYDQLVQIGGWPTSEAPSVLMVEIGPTTELTETLAIGVLEHLHELGARQTLFLTLPPKTSQHFYQKAQEYGNVLLAEPIGPDRHAHTILPTPQPSRGSSDQSPVRVGALSLPEAEFGVYRRATTMVRVGDDLYPSLAWLAANNDQGDLAPSTYLVNFNHGRNWLPRVSLDRVLNLGLIPELVRDRTVLIGTTHPSTTPGLHTPLDYRHDGMSVLEFAAYSVDTKLRSKEIRETPTVLNLAVLGLIGLVNLLVYQWFHLDRSTWFNAALVAAYVGLGWLLLHGLELWIPIAEMATAQVLMFWFFVRLKLMRDDQDLRHTILQKMTKLQEYMLPPDFYRVDEHWAQVITFVDQTLNLNRVIFLEKVEGDHRIREVKALRCSLADIDERRRDFERSPYKEAIAECGPIKLKERLFFKNPTDQLCEQYLVPLLFGGEIQGFWAFDAMPSAVDSTENFLGNIQTFANQIAELLYHRHRWLKRRDAESNAIRRFFQLEAGTASSREIGQLLDLLERRLNALQIVFNGLETASIQYDLFGRVVQLNKSMEDILRRQELPGYRMTALDLLVEGFNIHPTRARRLLRQVVADHREFRILATLKGNEAQHISVNLRPLQAPEAQPEHRTGRSPFQIAGILFELSDEKRLEKRHENREQLLDWMRLKIQAELVAMLEGSSAQSLPVASGSDILQSNHLESRFGSLPTAGTTVAPQSQSSLIRNSPFQSRVCEVLNTIDKVQTALSSAARNPSSNVCPVDLHPFLTSAIGETARLIEEKKIKLDATIPRLTGLVKVQPDQLRRLLKALLTTLITDAVTKSVLTVHLQDSGKSLKLTCQNFGFGIPDKHLQSHLWKPGVSVTEELKDLRDAVQAVPTWNGRIEIHSKVGVGIWAELDLEVVI